MALNFPSNPSLNDTYTFENRSWRWNGEYWQSITVTTGYTGSAGVIGYTGSSTYDQSLNTTDTVTFFRLNATEITSDGVGVPTIESSTNINLTAGNAVVVTSSPLALFSMSTTERNNLTPSNGWIIYNTTDNVFQGYANGSWVNLS